MPSADIPVLTLTPTDIATRDASVRTLAQSAMDAAVSAATQAGTAIEGANAAGGAASVAQTTADNAATAAAAAQTTATTASTNAATALSTATTAGTNAATALGIANGLVVLRTAGGTTTAYAAASNTDAARYTALAAAVTAHVAGDLIVISPGNFAVTATIALKSGVKLLGSGYGTRLYIDASVSGSNLNVITNADATNGNTDIVVEAIFIDGNNANVTSGRQQGITFTKVSEFAIRGNWIKHLGRSATPSCIGISPIDCTDGAITGNVIDDTVDGINTGQIAAGNFRLTISNNLIISTNRDYAFNLLGVKNSTFMGNVVKSSQKSAFNCQNGCIGNTFVGNVVFGTVTENCITLTGSTTPPNNNTYIGNVLRNGAANAIGDGGSGGNSFFFNDCRGGGLGGADIGDIEGTVNFYFGNAQTNGPVQTTGAPTY